MSSPSTGASATSHAPLQGHLPQTKEPQQSASSEAAKAARETKDEVVAQAVAAKERAMRQGEQYAEAQKGRTAEQMEVFSSAIREAADKLEQEGQEGVACYAEACADELDRAAGYLRNRDFRGLYQDTSRWARRRPEFFLGGMFVAGLALSRFLKASSSEATEGRKHGDHNGPSRTVGASGGETDSLQEQHEFTSPLGGSQGAPEMAGAFAGEQAGPSDGETFLSQGQEDQHSESFKNRPR